MVQLIGFQIIITFTIVSLAGGGLGKVEEVEEGKSHPRHPQGRILGLTIIIMSHGYWKRENPILVNSFQ